ncbi:hypothetical protein OUZ56_006952 [Daphnia magna]|uniref:Uncharacterized protein n=1 Tax=Daphnia magna TaxID=35525 RepID=A0ABQ9YXQ6_9CRUS|nr:hypothetical protein OUZ56_006952 [Daphnia magna]
MSAYSDHVNFGEDEFYFVGQVMVDQNDMHGPAARAAEVEARSLEHAVYRERLLVMGSCGDMLCNIKPQQVITLLTFSMSSVNNNGLV